MPRILLSLTAAAASLAACSNAVGQEQRAAGQSGDATSPPGVTLATSTSASSPPPPATAARAEVRPVLVELFTSQGCSSCPPADALIAEIAADPNVVVITRPVTYWDRLGWTDTLARPENTALQRAYAPSLEGYGGRSYTPQAVVNGRFGLVGSRRGELRTRIGEARDRATIRIIVEESAGGGRTVSLSGASGRSGLVELVALDPSETVRIGSGENGGRSVTYTNIVLADRSLGRLEGDSGSIEIPGEALANAARHALIVREGPAGPILAARYL